MAFRAIPALNNENGLNIPGILLKKSALSTAKWCGNDSSIAFSAKLYFSSKKNHERLRARLETRGVHPSACWAMSRADMPSFSDFQKLVSR